MNSKENLQLKIASQLSHDPLLKDAQIIVDCCNNTVIVKGVVSRYFKKAMVCKVVSKITGVKNITDAIEVVLSDPDQFHDNDTKAAIVEKFEKNFGNSYKNIDITIQNGHVILEGTLKWKYQKLLATECISYVEGIVSIQNNIAIAAVPEPNINEKDILAAIYKEESITADIAVDLNGRIVTISGKVATAFQKKLIEKLVRDVPGVQEIDSRLTIVKK